MRARVIGAAAGGFFGLLAGADTGTAGNFGAVPGVLFSTLLGILSGFIAGPDLARLMLDMAVKLRAGGLTLLIGALLRLGLAALGLLLTGLAFAAFFAPGGATPELVQEALAARDVGAVSPAMTVRIVAAVMLSWVKDLVGFEVVWWQALVAGMIAGGAEEALRAAMNRHSQVKADSN